MTDFRSEMTKMKSSKSVANVVRQNSGDQDVRSIHARFFHIASQVQDPRPRHIDYLLDEILFIIIVAVTCGTTSYSQIETFGNI